MNNFIPAFKFRHKLEMDQFKEELQLLIISPL